MSEYKCIYLNIRRVFKRKANVKTKYHPKLLQKRHNINFRSLIFSYKKRGEITNSDRAAMKSEKKKKK